MLALAGDHSEPGAVDTVSGSGVFYEDRSLTETRQSGGPYETGVVEGTFSVTCPGG
jgi:hypothetical protein